MIYIIQVWRQAIQIILYWKMQKRANASVWHLYLHSLFLVLASILLTDKSFLLLILFQLLKWMQTKLKSYLNIVSFLVFHKNQRVDEDFFKKYLTKFGDFKKLYNSSIFLIIFDSIYGCLKLMYRFYGKATPNKSISFVCFTVSLSLFIKKPNNATVSVWHIILPLCQRYNVWDSPNVFL